MSMGIPPEQLSDDELRHELAQLKLKQDDIERDGTPDQKFHHKRRTAELEPSFVERFAAGSDSADADREAAQSDAPQGEDAEPADHPQPGVMPGEAEPPSGQ